MLFLSFRFNSHLTFQRKLEKMQFARKAFFFSSFHGWGHSGWYLPSKQHHLHHVQPLAATCSHLQRGCKWLQIMQMAASDAALEISNPTSRATGHLRPLAATCPSGHLRPLAATRVAASGRKWLQVAAFWISNSAGFATSMHLYPFIPYLLASLKIMVIVFKTERHCGIQLDLGRGTCYESLPKWMMEKRKSIHQQRSESSTSQSMVYLQHPTYDGAASVDCSTCGHGLITVLYIQTDIHLWVLPRTCLT